MNLKLVEDEYAMAMIYRLVILNINTRGVANKIKTESVLDKYLPTAQKQGKY